MRSRVNSSEIKPCPAVKALGTSTRSERDPESGVTEVADRASEEAALELIVGVPVGRPDVSATETSVQPVIVPFSKLDFR
jgi:hypothetical protein